MVTNTSIKVLTISPRGTPVAYTSLSAASRVLSGDGSDRLRSTITNRVRNGGGYVGETWVQFTTVPVIRKSLV